MIEYNINYTKERKNKINEIQNTIIENFDAIKKLYLSLDENIWNNREKKN